MAVNHHFVVCENNGGLWKIQPTGLQKSLHKYFDVIEVK
jgi:hypothetical protein